MGTWGMSYSLQSRDLIADQVETAAGGHWLDGMVVIPGCDKNMPGVLMARTRLSNLFFLSSIPTPLFLVGRLNRPGLMVYGGTIRPGSCEGAPQLDIVSAFQSYGKYLQDAQTPEAERERYNTVRHACPGPGACGGVCCVYFYKSHKLTQKKDVYCEYNGQCRRGSWDDTTGFIFIPR